MSQVLKFAQRAWHNFALCLSECHNKNCVNLELQLANMELGNIRWIMCPRDCGCTKKLNLVTSMYYSMARHMFKYYRQLKFWGEWPSMKMLHDSLSQFGGFIDVLERHGEVDENDRAIRDAYEIYKLISDMIWTKSNIKK